jgi:hypothetical protein
MTNSRKARLLREAFGGEPDGIEVSAQEWTLCIAATVVFGLLMTFAATVGREARTHISGPIAQAHAQSGPVREAPAPAVASESRAAEGNVVDMTY